MERERQRRWDRENLGTISSKMLQGEYKMLRHMCDAEGVTVYALVRQLVRKWMMDNAASYR